MGMKNNTINIGGPGVCGVLGIVFIVLKLTEHIDWSWWWVLAPFWLPFVVILVGALIVGVVICLAGIATWLFVWVSDYLAKRRKK